MNVYLVCPVRKCPPEIKAELDAYVAKLEAEGHHVHYPHRDVDQKASGVEICRHHADAMMDADEVHVWWVPDDISTGSYWDAGMAYMLQEFSNIPIRLANPIPAAIDPKSYYAVLLERHQAAGEPAP